MRAAWPTDDGRIHSSTHRITALDPGPMGRFMAILFVGAGLVTIVSVLLPATPSMNRSSVLVVGVVGTVAGVSLWFLPWGTRLHVIAMWTIVPAAEVLIAFHNYYAGTDPYRYGLFFLVVHVWVGAAQPRWSTLRLVPVTLVCYEAPLVITHAPAWALWSAFYAVPIFLLVGEGIAWLAGELRRASALVEFEALHDPLTGLVNRLLLEERIEPALARARRLESYVGAIYLDVDGFKRINDTLGHHQGDTVLQEVARRLRVSVRACDTVARVGGDEFIVLVEDTSEETLRRAADRIAGALAVPFVIEDTPIGVTVSIGVAIGTGDTVVDLVRRSDNAMYTAKRRRRAVV